MELVNYPYITPEEMVALDELLLKKAEAGEMGETLRFWAAKDYFVVIGRASKIDDECFITRCRQDGIKIIRRSSGGHTVLQGPGCLNYSLVLSYESNKNFIDVRESYGEILGRLESVFKDKGHNVEFFPLSDLALNGKKFSGNAQTRKRKFFIHHGTILFDFDLDRISYYLKHPPTEPEYRKGRPHKDFVTNISIGVKEIKKIVKEAFLTRLKCAHFNLVKNY